MLNTADKKKNWYLSSFEQFEKNIDGLKFSNLCSIRRSAINKFSEIDFPTTKDEEWKYTDVSQLMKYPYSAVFGGRKNVVSSHFIQQMTLVDNDSDLLVCVDGNFSKDLSRVASSIPRLKFGSLFEAMQTNSNEIFEHLTKYVKPEENAFTALNTAFLYDGVFISVPNGLIVPKPIQILFVSTKFESEHVSYPRNLIIVGNNSEVSIIISYVSLESNTFHTNVVTEVVVGENAIMEYDVIQNESINSFHVGTTVIYQKRESKFFSNSISLGGILVRNNITTVLDGDGAETVLNGLYIASGGQHIDNHTTIDHLKPHCRSNELYKGILDGNSRGVFNGKIIVRKNAQKTNASQTNNNLILSDGASVDTKPQLEIFTDDIKCTHGATIGKLDEEAIYYLCSRGISKNTAHEFLIYAFANEVIEKIKQEILRAQLKKYLMHSIMHESL